MFHKLQTFKDWARIHFSRLIMRLKEMRELLNCLEKERLEGLLKLKTPYQQNGDDRRLQPKMLKTVADFKRAAKTTMANGMGLAIESFTWPAKETFSQVEVLILSVIKLTAEATESVHFHPPLAVSV